MKTLEIPTKKPPQISSKNNFERCRILVEKFLKPDNIVWSREIKITKALIEEHGFEFLNSMDLGFRFNSMAFLKTENGLGFIMDHRKKLEEQQKNKVLDELISAPKVYQFEEQKIGQDKKFPKRGGIKEFLDLDFEDF